MKILNLYSGIGGNRKLWNNSHKIIAIEKYKLIASIYQDLYPNDKVIITDAHNYLLEHYKEFDFIWSSPPCQTHSALNNFRKNERKQKYPDMRLYQEIIFLRSNFKGLFVVENVQPYYQPLVMPTIKLGRHLFWSNYYIDYFNTRKKQRMDFISTKNLEIFHDIDLSKYKFNNHKQKRQIIRNCVDMEIGKHILDCALNYKKYFIQQELLKE